MKRPHSWIVVGFLGIVFGVGLLQAGVEISRGRMPQAADVLRRTPSRERLRRFEQNLERASIVTQTLRPWVQYGLFAALGNPGEKALLGRDGWWFYAPGVQYLVEAAPDPAEPIAAIVSFHRQLEARGIRLMVMPMPGKASVYPDRLTSRAGDLARPVNGHTKALIEALRAAGVETLDMTEVFWDARRANEDALYLKQDTHWSPAGVALAAKTVGARVLDLGWVQTGNAAYHAVPTVVTRRGDVVEMMQAPPVERGIDPESVTCTKVVRADDGEPYQDDPAAEILVLGDSFLRIYQQDEPGSAGFIAHLALELKQPVLSIVNDGGASTLVRQALVRKPADLEGKKVVLWEFVERDVRFGLEGWQDLTLPPVPANAAGNRGS